MIAKGTRADKIEINGVDGSPPSIPLGSSLAILLLMELQLMITPMLGVQSKIPISTKLEWDLEVPTRLTIVQLQVLFQQGKIRLYQTIMSKELLSPVELHKYLITI